MKKYLVLLLVAVMAISAVSAASVATSQKVAATDGAQLHPIIVTYAPGARYVWTGPQCNSHETHTFWGDAHTVEWAYGGSASSMAQTPPGSDGSGFATARMVWALRTGSANWNDLMQKPVIVTMSVSYIVKADSYVLTIGGVEWGFTSSGSDNGLGRDSVSGQSAATKLVTTESTYTTTVGDLFSPTTHGTYTGSAYVTASARVTAPTPGAKEFSLGQISMNYVTLQFPKA